MITKIYFILHSCLTIVNERGIRALLVRTWSLLRYAVTMDQIKLVEPAKILHFEYQSSPEVSIIIPVHNHSIYTYNCLASILTNTEGVDYEVIVVDDASTDNTSELFSQVKNIQYVANHQNLGFVESCNKGAALARGKFIHFLNNDTVVQKGWLRSLVELFINSSSVGIAGSKLVYPNMILQEAGSIIWKDGTAANYGKFDKAAKSQYNFLREVDYCSGASLMVRKEFFDTVAGFDLRYAPAYWEDVDLCFAARRNGYKVLYQPDSVVVHFEGVSAGSDLTPGMKRFQEINQLKFREKWAQDLERHSVKKNVDMCLARERHGLGDQEVSK